MWHQEAELYLKANSLTFCGHPGKCFVYSMTIHFLRKGALLWGRTLQMFENSGLQMFEKTMQPLEWCLANQSLEYNPHSQEQGGQSQRKHLNLQKMDLQLYYTGKCDLNAGVKSGDTLSVDKDFNVKSPCCQTIVLHFLMFRCLMLRLLTAHLNINHRCIDYKNQIQQSPAGIPCVCFVLGVSWVVKGLLTTIQDRDGSSKIHLQVNQGLLHLTRNHANKKERLLPFVQVCIRLLRR